MLEVAEIFRDHGAAWREANRGHVSLDQMKVMTAIERCRTAALGGHVARCENDACATTLISYNSCRNRHCPKCQGSAARKWLAERQAELLSVSYFHVVYTLPSQLRGVAYQNKRVVYDLLGVEELQQPAGMRRAQHCDELAAEQASENMHVREEVRGRCDPTRYVNRMPSPDDRINRGRGGRARSADRRS